MHVVHVVALKSLLRVGSPAVTWSASWKLCLSDPLKDDEQAVTIATSKACRNTKVAKKYLAYICLYDFYRQSGTFKPNIWIYGKLWDHHHSGKGSISTVTPPTSSRSIWADIDHFLKHRPWTHCVGNRTFPLGGRLYCECRNNDGQRNKNADRNWSSMHGSVCWVSWNQEHPYHETMWN